MPRPTSTTICPPEHAHGRSLVCYNLHKCRCDACTTHRSEQESRRRKQIAYGRYDSGLVDAGPVREHMLMLGEHGLGYKRIGAISGIGTTAARTILWGRQEPGPRYGELQKRVKRETADAILAVKPVVENLAGGALVSAVGTQRRVQALVACGWSLSRVAAEVGMDISNFRRVLEREHVAAATYRAIRDLFDRWWDQEPPHATPAQRAAMSRAKRYAAARRWLRPLAWDDIDRDPEPPEAESIDGVDEIAVELACAGARVRLSSAERRAAVARLWESRWSDARIADALHVSDRTVLRIRRELGLKPFDRNELLGRGAA